MTEEELYQQRRAEELAEDERIEKERLAVLDKMNAIETITKQMVYLSNNDLPLFHKWHDKLYVTVDGMNEPVHEMWTMEISAEIKKDIDKIISSK